MKSTAWRLRAAGLLATAVFALAFLGCSSDSGSDDDSGGTSPAAVVGTWKSDASKDILEGDEVIGTQSDTFELTLNADGTYTSYESSIETYPDSPADDDAEYEAQKGTYTAANGLFEFTSEYRAQSDEPFTDGINWVADPGYASMTYAIIDEALAFGVMSRSGSGTGLEGTWTVELKYSDDDDIDSDGDVKETFSFKTTYVIEGDTLDGEEAVYLGGSWVVLHTWSATIELIDEDTVRITYEDGDTDQDDFFVNDEYLVIDSDKYLLVKE